MNHQMEIVMNWKNALLVGVCAVGGLAQAFVAKVGVLVVDDGTGKPLRDITVTGYFSVNNGWGAWGGVRCRTSTRP